MTPLSSPAKYRQLRHHPAKHRTHFLLISNVTQSSGRIYSFSSTDIPFFQYCFRYSEETQELINPELRVAYSIINGIPNLIPRQARLLEDDE
jgi:uncharacterized protein YbaR (Trm112 family)